MRFIVTSQECELLLAFEAKTNLEDLALLLKKDVSVVSRNLKSISQKNNLLEKQNGKWVLTEKGRALNNWTRDAIYCQRLSLEQQQNIKIASTREFASRVLLPNCADLVEIGSASLSIISTDAGIERLILAGNADFGFDCGRPNNPSIAFKRLIRERFVVVASPSFVEKFNINCFDDLEDKHLLRFMRNEGSVWDLDTVAHYSFGTFSDMANVRDASRLGYGWAVIPYYMVKKEIDDGDLVIVSGKEFPDQMFGVWWLRERKNLSSWIEKASAWLLRQELC